MHIHGFHNEIQLHTDVSRRIEGREGKAGAESTSGASGSAVAPSVDVAQSVDRYTARLREVPEVRSDIVERATARLNSGELLSRSAAEETAATLV